MGIGQDLHALLRVGLRQVAQTALGISNAGGAGLDVFFDGDQLSASLIGLPGVGVGRGGGEA
jgi:hypothetical protein